jgi:hypothetical protein
MAELGKGRKTAGDYLAERSRRLNGGTEERNQPVTMGTKNGGGGNNSAPRTITATPKMAELGMGRKTADDYMAEYRKRRAAEQERERAAQEAAARETAAREAAARAAAAQNAPTSAFRAGAANQSAALRRLAELAAQNELEREKREVSAPPVMPMARGNTILGGMYDSEMGVPDIGTPAAKAVGQAEARRLGEELNKRAVTWEENAAAVPASTNNFNAGEWAKANLGAGFTGIGAEPIRSANAVAEQVKNPMLDAAGWLWDRFNDLREVMPDTRRIGREYNLDGADVGRLPSLEPVIEKAKEGPALGPVYDFFVSPNEKWQQKAQTENEKGGMWANVGGQIIQNAVRQIPDTVLALASGGTSTLGKGADVVADGLGKAVYESAKDMATSPNFLLSYGQMYGQSYEDRVDAGASPLAAALTSTITTLMNSVVEMGGGIEDLPFDERNIGKWVTSMLDEGKEEVIQQTIDSLANKAFVNGDNPWFSIDDENAVINPKVLGENFLVGALAGGVMTGGGMLTSAATEAASNHAADRRLTQAIEKAAEQAAQNETAQNAPVDVSEAAMQVADRELGEEAGVAQAGAQGATEAPAAQRIQQKRPGSICQSGKMIPFLPESVTPPAIPRSTASPHPAGYGAHRE